MPNQEFNSRKYPSQTTRHLVIGAIILILSVGLSFVAFRMGVGAMYLALGTFAVIGMVIGLIWLVLSVLGWIAGGSE